jgi:hypothetical protein
MLKPVIMQPPTPAGQGFLSLIVTAQIHQDGSDGAAIACAQMGHNGRPLISPDGGYQRQRCLSAKFLRIPEFFDVAIAF